MASTQFNKLIGAPFFLVMTDAIPPRRIREPLRLDLLGKRI
jgi:hypothetical protein